MAEQTTRWDHDEVVIPPEQLPALPGRVMVAVAREPVRRAIEDALKGADCEIVTAGSAADAPVRWLAEREADRRVDAILLDATDGSQNAADVIRRLREGGYEDGVIVVAPEEGPGSEEWETFFDAGCDGIVNDPVRPIELVHRIVALMTARGDAAASSVLFVEDHLDLASVQKLLLESRGHFVTIATDAGQAMEAVRHFTPDAVLMDMGLPGGTSGADLLLRMKGLPALTDCRFICTSGRQEVEVPWKNLGFDAFLRKPSSLDDIVDTLTSR